MTKAGGRIVNKPYKYLYNCNTIFPKLNCCYILVMQKKIWRSNSFSILIVILSVLVIFSPVYFGNFAFHNDYRIWEYDHADFWFGYPESKHLLGIGRPLGMVLLNLHLLPLHTMQGVWLAQIFNILVIAAFAASFYYYLRIFISIKQFFAIILAILVVILPAMTINAVWITNLVPCLIPLFIALAAQYLMFKDKPKYTLIIGVLLLSMMIYPPATLFFSTLTFIKFIFGPLDSKYADIKKIVIELFLIIAVSVFYFVFIKLLKVFLLNTNFAGVDWSELYRSINGSFAQYKLTMNSNFVEKLQQFKSLLIFVFSAWSPLLTWPLVVGLSGGFLVTICYFIQSNTYLQGIENPRKTVLGLGLAAITIVCTSLALLAGPSVYNVNYRITFATMAIIPSTLILIFNHLCNKNVFTKYCYGLMVIILLGVSAISSYRLFMLVQRLTSEYQIVKNTIQNNIRSDIRTINIQRPVVLEEPIWLNSDFGLDATSYIMLGQIYEILSQIGLEPSHFTINYGSNFAKDPQAILIPKANVSNSSSLISRANIQGTWYYNGNPTYVKYLQQGLVVINEVAMESPAKIINSQEIYVPKWNCTGRLAKSAQILYWDNGTKWTRYRVQN